MIPVLTAQPLTTDDFAPFGDVMEAVGPPDKLINNGMCGRFHDMAELNFGPDGRAGISLFLGRIRTLPYRLEMLERHPHGSQAFVPMNLAPFLVITAPDQAGTPGPPRAFVTAPGQGINFRIGTWHGVLTPLAEPGLFAVVDRIGAGDNLEEHWLDTPMDVVVPEQFLPTASAGHS